MSRFSAIPPPLGERSYSQIRNQTSMVATEWSLQRHQNGRQPRVSARARVCAYIYVLTDLNIIIIELSLLELYLS